MTPREILNTLTLVADALPPGDALNRLRLEAVQAFVMRKAMAEALVEHVEALPVLRLIRSEP